MKTIYILRAFESYASMQAYEKQTDDPDYRLLADASCYALNREDLPFGGFLRQGYDLEDIAKIQVAADSNEYLAAYYGRHDAPALEVSNA